MKKLYDFLDLLRMKQWVKNAFVFFPLIFYGRLSDASLCQKSLIAVLGFCLLSSATYIFNDLCDLDSDRVHPEKANRPLASGRIRRSRAALTGLLLLVTGMAVLSPAGLNVLVMGLAYIALNYLYNILTKRIAILDVISIALGFHIRIWAGSLAIGTTPSVWLQVCTFVFTLFLGFAKRRHELCILESDAAHHRPALSSYTVKFLDQSIIICSTLAMTFYGFYTLYADEMRRIAHHQMLYSALFVVYGILRYLYLIYVKNLGDDAGEDLFTDRPLMIGVFLWAGYIMAVLYGKTIFPSW